LAELSPSLFIIMTLFRTHVMVQLNVMTRVVNVFVLVWEKLVHPEKNPPSSQSSGSSN
jgi:hypothetical protein